MSIQRLLSVCAMASLAAALHADIIAPSISGNVNGGPISDFGTVNDGPTTVTSAIFPGVSLTGQITHTTNDNQGAYALVTYDVFVNGGNMGDVVPLLVDYNITTDSLGDSGGDVTSASGSVNLSFANGTSGDSASASCGNVLRGGDCSMPNVGGLLGANAWAGWDNFVQVQLSMDVSGSGSANATVNGLHVFIDPTFAASNPQYSLELNVGNPAPAGAPEPATWALGGGALAICGFRLRKSRGVRGQ